jgi:hypothetical protein
MAEALPVAVAVPAPPSPLLSAQLYREMAASALGGARRAPAAALASLTLAFVTRTLPPAPPRRM